MSQAISAGLNRDAADGLIDLSNAYVGSRLNDEADAALMRAIDLAAKKGARYTEMRARLQQAALRSRTGRYDEAVAMTEAPFQFAVGGNYRSLAAQAKNIRSRAREYQGAYDEARALALEALAFAESSGNPAIITDSYENLAGQLAAMGRLPEALTIREKSERLHAENNTHGSLKFDIPNRAELLIRLNQTADARAAMAQLRERMASGHSAYADRARRLAQLEAQLAAVEHRFADLEGHIGPLCDDGSAKPDGAALSNRILREYGRVKSNRSRPKPEAVADWYAGLTGSAQREAAYWAGQTLVALHAHDLALSILAPALEWPLVQQNPELRWRLAALAALAIRSGAKPAGALDYGALANTEVRRLDAAWGGHATAYFARADLAVLRQSMGSDR